MELILPAAVRLAKTLEKGVIVAIICDRGDRYLSAGIFANKPKSWFKQLFSLGFVNNKKFPIICYLLYHINIYPNNPNTIKLLWFIRNICKKMNQVFAYKL